MKTTLFALLLLSASAALAQSAGNVLSTEPNIPYVPSHVARAAQHSMGEERNLLFQSTSTYARGERPLWEVAKPAPEVSLGEVARMLRQEHSTAKKAVKILEK